MGRRRNMQKLRGTVTVGAYHGSSEGVTIRIEDELSGCIVVECEMTMTAYAQAVTGRGNVPCEMSVNQSGLIGKKRENKRVNVQVPEGIRRDDTKTLKKCLKPHEVDGWEGHVDDLRNYHNHIGDGVFTVCFERWVD